MLLLDLQLAWAPGKGVKAKEWKDYWEVDQGVSYIPWSKLSSMTDWEALEEGGSFDEETLPSWVRNSAMVLGTFIAFQLNIIM